MRTLLVFVALAAALGLARADVVTLTNGNEFEGTILEDTPKRVVIEVRGGKLTFPRHLVKSVVKKAPPPKAKKPPKKPRKASPPRRKGAAPPSRGTSYDARNLYRELQGVAAIGERWEFRHAYHLIPANKRTAAERFGRSVLELQGAPGVERGPDGKLRAKARKEVGPPTSKSLTITWIGLSELHYAARASGPNFPKKLAKARARKWERKAGRRGWPPKDAGRETLTVSGRSIQCVVTTKTHKNGRVDKTWTHFRDGRACWPRVVKLECDGLVVSELTKIVPAPKGMLLPPPDAGVSVGDLITCHVQYREMRKHAYVVRAECPTEVYYKTERVRGQSTGRSWRWQPKTLVDRFSKRRVLGRETLTIDGREYPCVVIRDYHGKSDKPSRSWWHVGEDGRGRFPGRIRMEKHGKVIEDLLKFERR
jgi:hypothetical protein